MPRHVAPMRLLRIPEPLDHPDFIFEPKIDGAWHTIGALAPNL
jgi:hypothetical protein